ncbi:hypothetical protein JRG66_09420 [Salinimicrobium tongyeongense]|uniref:Uncharacterized protein n=1 Tax=Salinimicrobium tongyeongense TaxID=2809707 RepID=A0ABY6NMX5_9FLAO|nr:hypothetical protein [Salinimicrobium tongyeongense]UZH54217.1 hypothetical protein JRG66_09420 [Salinimicrobium tongyeongense]
MRITASEEIPGRFFYAEEVGAEVSKMAFFFAGFPEGLGNPQLLIMIPQKCIFERCIH